MLESGLHSRHEVVEPLDDWLLLQPAMEEETRGRIVLPPSAAQTRLERGIVLAVGASVGDLAAGDVVLALAQHAIRLRDGSALVQRPAVVARIRD